MNEELWSGHFSSPADFARKGRLWAEAQGASRWWCALEWNDPTFGNQARSTAVRNAVESENGVYTIWLTRPFTGASARQAAVESQCKGILLEGEIPAENGPDVPNPQAVNWPDVIFHLHDLPIHKGVVTNFAPFVKHDGRPWPEKASALINAGWSCHTECYDLFGDPTIWPERRDFFAKQIGWSFTQPVLGCYDGRTLDTFPTRNNYANWSVWDAGSIF